MMTDCVSTNGSGGIVGLDLVGRQQPQAASRRPPDNDSELPFLGFAHDNRLQKVMRRYRCGKFLQRTVSLGNSANRD